MFHVLGRCGSQACGQPSKRTRLARSINLKGMPPDGSFNQPTSDGEHQGWLERHRQQSKRWYEASLCKLTVGIRKQQQKPVLPA